MFYSPLGAVGAHNPKRKEDAPQGIICHIEFQTAHPVITVRNTTYSVSDVRDASAEGI